MADPNQNYVSISGVVTYKGTHSYLKAGRGEPVRVNLSVGLNRLSTQSIKEERSKIKKVLGNPRRPDLMMDLSISKIDPEPWEIIQDEFEGPIGILPHYLVFDEKLGIERNILLERIHALTQKGIAFITVHASPTLELFHLATKLRATPITSRGGSAVIRDMLINNRSRSIYFELFDNIASLAAQTGIVINLGTAFRSASVSDGMDLVTIEELKIQKELVKRAHSFGAQVVLEGPGHLLISQIDDYLTETENLNVPLMPLGPIITDALPGLDHITNSIGASYMMTRSKGGIINCVTRVEHQGGVPNASLLIEALDSAHVAAHAASISYHKESRVIDQSYSESRAKIESCVLPPDYTNSIVLTEGAAGCTRCGHLCPLINSSYERK